MFELTRALQGAGRRIDTAPQLIGAALILLSAYFLGSWMHWVSLFVAVVLVVVRLVAQMSARDGRAYRDVVVDVLAGGFVQVYVPFLASLALVLLRQPDGTLVGRVLPRRRDRRRQPARMSAG